MTQATTGHVKEVAARIALAVRSLPGVEIGTLVDGLISKAGSPLTLEKLAKITVPDVQAVVQHLRDAPLREEIKQAVRYLWGEGTQEDDLPAPQSLFEGEMPQSVRLAIASNTAENLDGHFGSCKRFLIYQVTVGEARLIELRDPTACADAENPNEARAKLLEDCDLVYVQSIGGPAAAKVIRAGIHPVKFQAGGPVGAAVAQLQQTLKAPPPWLARVMGVQTGLASRFATQGEDA